ncbi:hypothetical protein GCM10010449_84700 [Streptomyces rectiviolaceus]|uniref:Integral membrane protein n=2 Tax=Streptomyces rectiviolaceus TaxID=332591 RepID=A0ABP6NPG6_9ACTN
MDAVLLVGVDVLMLRMVFHGVPYFGPRLARAARSMVENRTTNPVARAVVRAGAPTAREQENVPRGPRTVPTPGRAMTQDRDVLFAAYGLRTRQRPGRLTTDSAIAQTQQDAQRRARLTAARRQAHAANPRPAPAAPNPTPPAPGPGAGGPTP